MEITQLQDFMETAERGRFRRAAKVLYTTQPSVSARIKALETEMGFQSSTGHHAVIYGWHRSGHVSHTPILTRSAMTARDIATTCRLSSQMTSTMGLRRSAAVATRAPKAPNL